MKSCGSFLFLFAVLLLLFAVLIPRSSQAMPLPAQQEVQAAWQHAQRAGAYRFATEIVQTTHPAPALANVGRGSRQDTLYIEGQANLANHTLLMTLWQSGGSVLGTRDGIEVRIEGDRAYGRQLGGAWEEIPDFSGAFAPANDLLAYLAGAKNVRQETPDQNEGASLAPDYTLYRFDVDGPAFAVYLRDQMERYLVARGELPVGLTLESSALFNGVTGEGRIWIDSDGFPLRIAVHLQYPPQENGDQIEAQIRTDFSGFDRQQVTASSTWQRIIGALRNPESRLRIACQISLILGCLALVAALITYAQSKRAYAASARDLGDGRIALLVPLNVVADESGGGRAAFGARIPYAPQGPSLGDPQEMRVVWLVQMLTDTCRPMPPGSETSETWCRYEESWSLDNTQIVHTYYDDWYITGLTVREDHGTDVAIAWEDPSAESQADRQYDDWLWLMAMGLERTYLAGRDQDNNTRRDIGVVTHADGRQVADTSIAGRFDAPLAPSVTITDRLGVPPTATLQVETFSYPQQDYIAHVMMTETVRILNTYFTPWANADADAPTLLFLRDEYYRAAELGSSDAVSQAGARATFDLQGRQVETVASLSWAPYRYQGGKWASYPLAEYWNRMYARFYSRFLDTTLPADWQEDVARGRTTLAQSYYLALMQGRASLVAAANQAAPSGALPDDEDIAKDATDRIENAGDVAQAISDMVAEPLIKVLAPALSRAQLPAGVTQRTLALRELGAAIRGGFSDLVDEFKQMSRWEKASVGFTTLATAAAIGFAIAALAVSDENLKNTLEIVAASLATAAAVVSAAETIVKAVRGTLEPLTKAGKIAAVVGTVIAVGLAIGLMIATLVLGPKTAEAILSAIAVAIGQIIAAVILLAISLIPVVGQVIIAIIGAIDAVVALICAVADGEETWAGKMLCGGISGLIAQRFTPYSYNVMVNVAEEGRLQFNPFDYTILQPELGLQTGNELEFTTTVTNTIEFAEFPPDWRALVYSWEWNELTLRSSTFAYRWQAAQQDIHDDLDLGEQIGDWTAADWTRRFPWLTHRLYMVASPTGDNASLNQAGINQPLQLFLAEGYALPAQECILIPIPPLPIPIPTVPVCWVRAARGTEHTDMGQIFTFDVFPPTLDEFYQAVPLANGGYSLAWGQSGDVTFGRQVDFDGDGLPNAGSGGSDPDDSRWDADGDGLSDRYEFEHGSSPTSSDTDNDGLDDAEEALRRTDPARQDSDGDGLTDGEEVTGWEFVYAFDPVSGEQLRTWVTSDPLSADSDGDGLPDFREYAFGLNPRVPSDPSVLSLEARMAESGVTHNPDDLIIRGGDVLRYTATVRNTLDSRHAQGLFWLNSSAPAVLDASRVPPVTFVLPPRAQATLAGTLQAPPATASQAVSLTQVAGALITDWRQDSNFAEAWLRLEEVVTATQFVDSSGSIPPRNAFCAGANCPARQVNGYIGYGVQFDGADDYLYINDSPGFDFGRGGLTIAMWVNPQNWWGGRLLSWRDAQGDGLEIYLADPTSSDLRLKVDLRIGGEYNGTVVPDGGTVGRYGWHHVAVVRDGAGNWTTYVDGVQGGSGWSIADLNRIDPGTPIWLGAGNNGGAPTSAFGGFMDEVYIFRRRLTPEEVVALYGRPVLRLQLESSTGIRADSSGLGNHAECPPTICPPLVPGVSGNAAEFRGADYLRVPSSPSLDLSGGKFTIAAWVYPQNTGDPAYDNYVQGIWGRYDGLDNTDIGGDVASSPPTLFRVGNDLRFGYGDGSAWRRCNFAGALTPNTWNHIAITYDAAQARLYVNGAFRESCNLIGTPRGGDFYVGRASTRSRLTINSIYVSDEADGSGTAEICMSWNNQYLWQELNADAGHWYGVHKDLDVYDSYTLRMWEDDPGKNCDDLDGDDEALDSGGWPFSVSQPGFSLSKADFSGDSRGEIWRTYRNPSLPFRGLLDDLIIYRRPLDAAEVNELYLSAFAALHLPLDDAPGSNSLENAVDLSRQSNATCSPACPTTGVSGRTNQAALFDGADDGLATSLWLDQSSSSRGATLMAWVYPGSASSGQHQVLSTGAGWSLLRDGGTWAVFNGSAIINTGVSVDVNRWQHIAAVFQPGSGVRFYKNGVPVGGWMPINYNYSTSPLVVGRHPNGGQHFDGRIDDVRIFSTALSNAEVQRMFRAAPVFQAHLDDPLGATTFTDDANGNNGACSGNACPTVGESSRGQIGTAAAFDGVDDVITVADNALLDLPQFSVGAWVMPTAIRPTAQALLGKGNNYNLSISPGGMTATVSFCGFTVAGQAPLMQNQWNHVLATYDGATARLYINGYEQGHRDVASLACPNADPLRLGSGFAGSLDEVTLYDHALSPFDVRDIFFYQARWVEARYTHDVLVDNDFPFSTLRSYTATFPYLANRDVVMHIEAQERTSRIASVALGIRRDGQPGYAWTTAPRCLDVAGDTAYCPTFTPSGEGRYDLQTRATDVVSHTETPTTTYTIYVDGTPPQVGFDTPAWRELAAARHPSRPDTWLVHLSGTIADPPLVGGYPGSSVDPRSVRVQLTSAIYDDPPLRPGEQLALVSGNTWSIDYQIFEAQPSNWYTVTVQAADRVGNAAAYERIVGVDAAAPVTNLEIGLPEILTETAGLRGDATDLPVSVAISWTVGSPVGETGITISCGPVITREITRFAEVYTQPAGDQWNGLVDYGDPCQIVITNTLGTNNITGTAQVCGLPALSWAPTPGYSTTLTLNTLLPACRQSWTPRSTVCQAQTEFVPTAPGSSYHNDLPMPGSVLQVPFDDQPDVNGVLRFRDLSASRLSGSCQGTACPATGQAGHDGRTALFDGQDDSVLFGNVGAFNATTLSAWVQRTGATGERETAVSYKEDVACGAVLSLNEDGTSQYPRFAVNVGGTWQAIEAAQPVPADAWVHLVGTYDGTTLILYLNGQPVASAAAPGALQQCTADTAIGSHVSQTQHFFPGLIDDVRILDHALPPDQVRALYLGSGPLLALPFDQEWATDGATLADDSGWEQPAVLVSGDALNKAVPGAVGTYALRFDGIDDYVSVPNSASLNPPYLTIAGWVKADNFAEHGGPIAAKGTGAGGEVWALDFDYGVPRIYFFKTGDTVSTECRATGPLSPGQWYHVAGTYDGTTERLYINGVLNNSCHAARGPLDANTHIVSIGSRQSGSGAYDLNFAGALDDMRIYPRALDTVEIWALYQSGWRTAALPNGTGNGILWNATVPEDIEGPYRLDLRAQDCLGLLDTSVRSQGAWRGEVDTLDPRVLLTRETVDGRLRYTATAVDYNLIDEAFSSPCGAGVATTRELYQSPWYMAAAGQSQGNNGKLYRLVATCDLAAIPSLVESGAYNTPGIAHGVAVAGNTAYVADGHRGLRVVNIANPQQPRPVGHYPVTEPALAIDVAVSGNYAYLVVDDPAGDRLDVVDISTPSQPQFAGSYAVPGTELARGITSGGSPARLYLPASIAGQWGVLILTAAPTPVYVGHILTAGQPRGIAISGGLAYVTEDSGNTLHIFQLSPVITELGNYALPDTGWGVAVAGNYAYVAADLAGLQILDVSTPATPTLTASFDTPGLARAVIISGTHALVADGTRGLQMIDVSIPSFPQSVGSLDTPGQAVDVGRRISNYACVADESAGLRVILLQPGPAERVTACDAMGHCVIAAVTLPGPPETARVAIGNVPPVLDSLTPFSFRGTAEVLDGTSLKDLTLTLDGAPFYSVNWPSGTVTQTTWNTAPTLWPPAEGPHQVRATVTTWGGGSAVDVADIIIDTLPPAIGVAPTVLTMTHYSPPIVNVSGIVTDASLPYVDVVWKVGSAAWQPAALTNNVWNGEWYASSTPDGVTYTVSARATDIAGHQVLTSHPVLVDIVPPRPVTLTLSSAGGVIPPGTTLRGPTPTITLTWTASSDGSGISSYQTRWTSQATTTLNITSTTYGPAARSNTYSPGEGQKVWAYLTTRDTVGNRREQSIGPIYADTPFTPDYLDRLGTGNPLNVYRGWMESGCSQVGVDRRVNRSAPAGATLSAIQRFYVTWNSEALRMTWTGANWSANGDLFVYLDLAPGGATTAYNPYGAGPAIHLPGVTPTTTTGAMAADYLVWVRDAQTATLLRWNGSAWVAASNMAQNSQFQFIAGLNNGQTDLYLPFRRLGITDPAATALDVVALASEEGILNLWAAMPNGNPLNSPRIVGAIDSAAPTFALSYRYHWDNLGAGICPNGSLTPAAPQYTDSDLHATLTVEPAGTMRRMDAAQRWQWQALGGDAADVDWLLGMSESGAVLGDGSIVTFTLRVENWGTVAATGVLGDVSSYHALQLSGGAHLLVNLGNIAPGSQSSQTFVATVDRATALAYYAACTASQPDYACFPYLRRATLQVEVYDDAHDASGPPLEQHWSLHPTDTQPPQFVGILQPGYVIAPRNNTLVGYAYDESGVPTVTLSIASPSGPPAQLVCPDSTPGDGRWTCAWDTTGAVDGDTYDVDVQATDRYGQTGSASRPRAFLVDALPPTVTLDLAASHLDVSNVIGSSQYPLYGSIADNRGLGSLDVCVDGHCAAAQLWPGGGDATHVYDDVPAAPVAIGAGTACGSGAVVRTFTVSESFILDSVTIGLDIEHGRRDDILAELISPLGTRVRLLYHSGATGGYRANYDVLLDDAAASAYAAGGGDDPAAAYYDRPARPNEPLQAFYGQDSAGTWTLSICDLIPASENGLYHRSQLILQPRQTAALAGDWTYLVSNNRPMDWVTQTVSLYGEDLVGNRMTTPLTVEVIVDNVPPVITTTQLVRSLGLTLTVAALTGIATDGGGVAAVFVTVDGPEGIYLDTALLNGNVWRYNLRPLSLGIYRLQVTAVDRAGNISTTPYYDIEIRPVSHYYLPLVARRYIVLPDLVIQNIIATPRNVRVVIRNAGNAPVEDEFWVDAYINPRTAPTRVNQTWDQLGSQGLAWGVTAGALPLNPGETLTLTVGGPYYRPDFSRVTWPLAVGTPVYGQVDALNLATTYGAVLETHEAIREDYNNIEESLVVRSSALARERNMPHD